MDISEKLLKLENILESYGKICVAYSGGTDSDFLLNMAAKVLGNNVIAVIAEGKNTAAKDIKDALRLATHTGVRTFVETVDVFSEQDFRNNTKDRCYYCKKNIMSAIFKRAEAEGFSLVADGKNADDAKHFRPGTAPAAPSMWPVMVLVELLASV